MATAHTTIPSFEVQTEAAMDAALALRAGLKDVAGRGDPVPSINDLLIKACALALRRHPRVNASYTDGNFVLHSHVNVGFAVAAEDALIVPTVCDADTKSLGAIARETRELAERVRSGRITPAELSGATFTVSNLGMYGMTAIRPVINPPQASILGVGAARQTLVRSRGRDRRPHAGHAHAVERPPDPLRRRRGPVPGRRPGADRGAVAPRALIADPVAGYLMSGFGSMKSRITATRS